MKKRLLILATALMTVAPLNVAAAVRVIVSPYYRVWYGGPYWGPYWSPYWGPGYPNPYVGDVKLHTKVKDAQVFLDGAYAGTTRENKTIHLRPGRYNLQIREGGRTQYSQRIFVIAGRTLHLHPEL